MKKILIAFFISWIGWSLSSCEQTDSSPKALVNVFLVDNPAIWDSVIVTIEGVELEYIRNSREGQVERLFIPYELADKEINISELVGGRTLSIGRRELDLGKITGATLVLGQGHSLFQANRRFPLTISEGKTEFPGEISIDLQAGVSFDIVVDLDLEKSIRLQNPQTPTFTFEPVIRVFSGIGTGQILGTIAPATLSPAIYAILEGDSISTHANSSGAFELRLDPGSYTVFIDPKDEQYFSDTLVNVQVVEGTRTNLNRITLTRK